MGHEEFECRIIGIGQLINLFMKSDMSQSIVLVSYHPVSGLEERGAKETCNLRAASMNP